MRRIAALAAGMILLVAGCAGQQVDPAPATALAAIEQLRAAESMLAQFRLKVSAGAAGTESAGEGSYRLGRDPAARVTGTLTLDPGVGKPDSGTLRFELVEVRGARFLKSQPPLTPAGKWTRLAERSQPGDLKREGATTVLVTDPLVFLDVQVVGSDPCVRQTAETVGGTETTRYSCSVLTGFSAGPRLQAWVDQYNPGYLGLKLWVDEPGELRQFAVDGSLEALNAFFDVTFTVREVGGQVTVSAPPMSEVTDAAATPGGR